MSIIKERPQNMLFVCVTVGLVLLASKYRDNIFRGVKHICHSLTQTDKKKGKKHKDVKYDDVILADTWEKCDLAVQNIRGNITGAVLGFDCEWTKGGSVSLVQLATHNGVCALFRVGKIGSIPPKLKELLANRRLLKVGVAPFEDGKKLRNDFGCPVSGTLDLRKLASRLNQPCPKSLAALCMQYLGTEMDKIMEVRMGDWDADTLSEEQINYAAFDAHAAVLIYHEILMDAEKTRSFLDTIVLYIKNAWNEDEDEKYHVLPRGVLDERFTTSISTSSPNMDNFEKNSNSSSNMCNSEKIADIAARAEKALSLTNKQLPTRNKPLYHNCYLQAPDGETLCTCDRKKAEWYVSKKLGEVVCEDPFTVKLSFEPSGRALGQVGQYYTQVKVNQCVVCGSDDKFIRKNVVPREYRKYFPTVMKAHQSHDVLLLCPMCHEMSNAHDLELRRELAQMCNAPLNSQKTWSHNEANQKYTYQKYQNATKVLKMDNIAIPEIKRRDFEKFVEDYTNNWKSQNVMPTKPNHNKKVRAHGAEVVDYFERRDGGLVELEKLWRQHFLKTMQPKYLPKLWSVSHNQERLVIRQTQNRINPEDARIAGLTGAA